MTLDEAIFELHKRGLPCPSAISVFFLYHKIDDGYCKDKHFETKFAELLKIQHEIQRDNSFLAKK
jgi:hypothetical protein